MKLEGYGRKLKMRLITSKISRKSLYKQSYEPDEIIKSEKIAEESDIKFYDEAAKLLTRIYLNKNGGDYIAK